MVRRILSLIFCSFVIMTFASCEVKSPQYILDEGMSQFGDGKIEENFNFGSYKLLLDELVDKYSGSYYKPTGTSMTDDEHDDAKKAQGSTITEPDKPDPSDDLETTAPSDEGKVPQVSNMTELMRVFHDAYDQTAESVEFTTVSGFSFNMNNDLQAIYTELQRKDPIDVSGVEYWSTWNSGNDYFISIFYSFDVDELKTIKAETIQLVADAVKDIGADELSDYEKVCAVNEYLCDNVYYPDAEPYEPITHTAYGALKNGCAVCEGYACAAKLILNSFGIECDIEVGDCLNGGGHAWNLVKLDGAWYQLDVTWNDQSNDRTDYLLVTDEYMKQSRTWDENDYPVSSKIPYSN